MEVWLRMEFDDENDMEENVGIGEFGDCNDLFTVLLCAGKVELLRLFCAAIICDL